MTIGGLYMRIREVAVACLKLAYFPSIYLGTLKNYIYICVCVCVYLMALSSGSGSL
jgi:hypothetical protein